MLYCNGTKLICYLESCSNFETSFSKANAMNVVRRFSHLGCFAEIAGIIFTADTVDNTYSPPTALKPLDTLGGGINVLNIVDYKIGSA